MQSKSLGFKTYNSGIYYGRNYYSERGTSSDPQVTIDEELTFHKHL